MGTLVLFQTFLEMNYHKITSPIICENNDAELLLLLLHIWYNSHSNANVNPIYVKLKFLASIYSNDFSSLILITHIAIVYYLKKSMKLIYLMVIGKQRILNFNKYIIPKSGCPID